MKQFTEPEVEVLRLEVSDVIATSVVYSYADNELIGWMDE